jgi:hypothetical protein
VSGEQVHAVNDWSAISTQCDTVAIVAEIESVGSRLNLHQAALGSQCPSVGLGVGTNRSPSLCIRRQHFKQSHRPGYIFVRNHDGNNLLQIEGLTYRIIAITCSNIHTLKVPQIVDYLFISLNGLIHYLPTTICLTNFNSVG